MSTTTRARTAAHHVRKTHKTLKTAMPVITSAVSLLGAIAVAMEAVAGSKTQTNHPPMVRKDVAEDDDVEEDEEEGVVQTRYSPLAHLMTLAHYLLKGGVLLTFVALVAYLVYAGGPTVAAVTLTVLIMAVIWLSEVVSRRDS